MSTTCRRCRRPLKNPAAVQAGIGPVCAKKLAAELAMQDSGQAMIPNMPFSEHGLVCRRDERGAHVNIPQQVVRHSPTGMEWGYSGSGPADLALNTLLAIGLPLKVAERHHQAFKFEVIATIPEKGGNIPFATISAWVNRLGYSVARIPIVSQQHELRI